MRPISVVFLAVIGMAAWHPVAADQATPAPGPTYIPGSLEVPPFVPPVPVEPTKPLTDAEATFVTRDEKGVTTTLQRGQASMAADLPAPVEPPAEPFTGQLPTLNPRPIHFTVSGVVYDHTISVAKWQHPVTKEPYEAILGFDLGLLSGISKFVHQGNTCHSVIFLSHHDTQGPMARRAAALGRPIQVPVVATDAYQLLKGNPQDPAGLQALLALRDVYLAEKPRLLQHAADRRAYQQQAQAWAEAHPVPKPDPVFWFKPHRNSRYLTEQDIADQQQAADQRAEQEGEQP